MVAVEHSRVARMVPSVSWGVAGEQDHRADRGVDKGKEELRRDGFLVVDRGPGSREDVAALASEERAVACRAADHELAVAGQLV